jgi:hypothetical protein
MNRSNAYYLARMRDEHPAIYADYLAKKFKNASEAIRSAGLKKAPSPLDTLRTAWAKASTAEQATFLAEIGCTPHVAIAPAPAAPIVKASAVKPATPVVPGSAPVSAIHIDGYLTQTAKKRITEVMVRRKIKLGIVMKEMGYDPRNASIGLAAHQDNRIRDESLLDALENWLAKQAV